jgi:phosphoribosylglycinamide formyltransferase-1
MKNIVILISGGGSNMAAIVRAAQQQDWARRLDARVAAVVSNKAGRQGPADGARASPPPRSTTRPLPTARPSMPLMAEVDRHDPTLVVLAGFMRILTPGFVAHYTGRLLNIHPSLLPAFPGLHTHQRAIDMGCRVAGPPCTR